jgi:DNA-binding response OmpR family regulator
MSNGDIRLLVVDDEEMIRSILKDFLEDEGFLVDTAETGKEAIDMLGEHAYDVAIVDMRLPDMDGNTCILQALQHNSGTVYFIHTGSHDYQVSPELQAKGVDPGNVFYKPIVDMTEIGRRIRSALGK